MEEERHNEVMQDLEEREGAKGKDRSNVGLEEATTIKEHEHEKKKQNQQNEKPETKEDFPDVFYCPLTGKIMKDPVVHPDGTSCERSAVEGLSDDVVCYPNRALQAIIQQEILRRNIPLQRTVDSVRKSFFGLVQRSNLSLSQDAARTLSDQFYCSITYEIMKNPVIDPDGQTFERRAIVNWIRIHGNSPTTRNPLSVRQLYKNNAIKDLLDAELARDDESMDGSVRRWKEQAGEDDDGDEWDLEEGNHPDGGNGASFPSSMEEIQERQRRRRGQERLSRFRSYLMLAIVFAGLAFFPYTTIVIILVSIIVIATTIAICIKYPIFEMYR